MTDVGKVIKAIEQCISSDKTCEGCPYEGTVCTTTLNSDVLVLLKEQEETINNLEDTVRHLLQNIEDISEYVTQYGKVKDVKAAVDRLKEQEKQKFFVDESGKITPLQEIVQCKDCKHGHKCLNGRREPMVKCELMFDEWLHDFDWFCADGERRE